MSQTFKCITIIASATHILSALNRGTPLHDDDIEFIEWQWSIIAKIANEQVAAIEQENKGTNRGTE